MNYSLFIHSRALFAIWKLELTRGICRRMCYLVFYSGYSMRYFQSHRIYRICLVNNLIASSGYIFSIWLLFQAHTYKSYALVSLHRIPSISFLCISVFFSLYIRNTCAILFHGNNAKNRSINKKDLRHIRTDWTVWIFSTGYFFYRLISHCSLLCETDCYIYNNAVYASLSYR